MPGTGQTYRILGPDLLNHDLLFKTIPQVHVHMKVWKHWTKTQKVSMAFPESRATRELSSDENPGSETPKEMLFLR